MDLENNTIQHLDFFTILPLYGQKKTKKLQFSEYSFNYRDKSKIPHDVLLEGLEADSTELKLKLGSKGYVLRSASREYFECNGTLVKHVLLQDGDRVKSDENILIFHKKHSEKLSDTRLEKIAQTKSRVLFQGETGIGKSYHARKLHDLSGRRGKFVQLNLSTFSESLLESEIFGHEKGAFTGAYKEKLGGIELAKDGTLFLDEIDSLSKNIQLKLLLFLDNHKFRRVGAEREKSSNARLVFASSRKIDRLHKENIFRSDFYYRLDSSFIINLDPLREKKEKIQEICFAFEKKHQLSIDRKLISFYQTLSWPGNIRQLLNHLEKKYLFSKRRFSYDELDQKLSKKLRD